MTVVATVAGSRTEADLIVGMLGAHGIEAHIDGNDVDSVYLSFEKEGVRVLVSEEDADEARRLIGVAPATQSGELNAFQRLVVRLLGGRRRT